MIKSRAVTGAGASYASCVRYEVCMYVCLFVCLERAQCASKDNVYSVARSTRPHPDRR